MKKTLTKIMSVIMAIMVAASCASIAFADEEKYICGRCGAEFDDATSETIHFVTVHLAQDIAKNFSVEIKNNPGSTSLNYGETLKLTAVVMFNDEPSDDLKSENYKWKTDSSAVKITSYGKTCEIEAVKTGTATITLVLVDDEGNEMTDFTDSQTITVKAGFFEKFISFFKDLFGMDRTIVQ